jgi:preprotein translocase subunit SecA
MASDTLLMTHFYLDPTTPTKRVGSVGIMNGHSSGENSSANSKEERRQLYQADIVTLTDSSTRWQL